MPLEERRKISKFNSFSSSRTALDKLGWDMKSRLAASLMEPLLTMPMIYFSCCRVMGKRQKPGKMELFLFQVTFLFAEDASAILLHVQPEFPGLLLTFSETGAEITVNETGSKFLCRFFSGLSQ